MKSPWLFLVPSVSGLQIINNTWVWFSDNNIPPVKKNLKQNMTQCGTKATGLGVMIGKCSLDSQHWRTTPANVGCSFFRYTNDDLRNHNNQRRKRKRWSMEDNQFALHCYFRSNPSQKGFRKRMIEIRQECASFHTTSQRLADQVRIMIKTSWFSDLEKLKKHQKINNEQDDNIVPGTSRINKRKQKQPMETLHNQITHNQTTP